ncbi:ABC transporter permease [Kibdelosporangium lantanae]
MTVTQSRALARDYGVYAALLILILLNLIFTRDFSTPDNLRAQAGQFVPVLVVALGMALVVGTGGIDASAGSIIALTVVLLPVLRPYGPVVAILLCLVVGVLAGLVSGSLVAVLGLPPIVATLAVLVGVRGLAVLLAGRTFVSPPPTLGGIGIAVLLAVAVAFLVDRTAYGHQLKAVGVSRTASLHTGLPVRRVLVTTYVLSGLLAAVAGLLTTPVTPGPVRTGELVPITAITAVALGGTPLAGGHVRILATTAGALVTQLVIATLTENGVPTPVAQMAQALVLVVVLAVQRGGVN